ncbi:MAG: PepSY domain-containing protein [Gammaproteobacteria bacterium]
MLHRPLVLIVSLLILVCFQGSAWADSGRYGWRDGRDPGRYEWQTSQSREGRYRNDRRYQDDRGRQQRRYEQESDREGREHRRRDREKDSDRSQGLSADDAARIAQRRYGGRVLRVESLDDDGSRYRVKLLSRDRRVRQVIVDAGG